MMETVPGGEFSALQAMEYFLKTGWRQHLRNQRRRPLPQHLCQWYRQTVLSIPAYVEYLQKHGMRAQPLADLRAFGELPLTTKTGYVHGFPVARRCPQGNLTGAQMWAASSGSTGEPAFWPRDFEDEIRMAWRFEQVFDQFAAREKSTLAVVCFALGNWVGGMFTTQCCRLLAMKGYRIGVATPGNHVDEILRVIHNLGGCYDQIVLLGYPPFIKGVIEEGLSQNMPWDKMIIKMVYAGEVFSETWRELVHRRAGQDAATVADSSASLYGTADGGVLGHETRLSVSLRRYLAQNPEQARDLFGDSRLPTLVQYNPYDRYFEVDDHTLVVSGDNGVPLVRYHIADRGGIIDSASMASLAATWGVPWPKDPDSLPFVYLFGRADFTVSYFGANIYPENITVALEQEPVCSWSTGKFVMQVEENAGDHQLILTVEMRPGDQDPGDGNETQKCHAIAAAVRRQLLRLNSEFAHYVPAEKQLPRVRLKAFADPEYFPGGVKHRYTR